MDDENEKCDHANKDDLLKIILNTRTPLVLRDFKHNWICFQRSLEDWCQAYTLYGCDPDFECMPHRNLDTPQWERLRRQKRMSATEFLENHKEEIDYWSALYYKRRCDLPENCTEGVNWSEFGITDSDNDFTIWLGSKGANTPCHYDTYGCNVVVQVYGSKSWLLFPPETALTKTRMPYEESSVYCLENFYSPSQKQIEKLMTLHHTSAAHRCVLQPNDVLIVPRHWWHFVESLDNSLSVNYWIPLEVDKTVQLDECILKYLIEKFKLNDHEAQYVFNPNELQELLNDDELLLTLDYLLKRESNHPNESSWWANRRYYPYQYLSDHDFNDLLNKENVKFSVIPKMTPQEYRDILTDNSKRLEKCLKARDAPMPWMKKIFLESLCTPMVINSIKTQLLSKYEASRESC